MELVLPSVELYTDGGAEPNPGRGGWACVLVYGEHRRELSGAEDNVSNNRMELMAAVMGLEAIKKPCRLTIISDSQWMLKCAARQWGRNVHQDLWARFDFAAMPHELEFKWVRGHAGHPLNERCHELAQAAIYRKAG